MKNNAFAMMALLSLLALVPELVSAEAGTAQQLEKREESFKVFSRKRNGHACIMSIVFMVLYPLGAISVHLPIDRMPFLRNTYLRRKIMAIHAPIQLLAYVMMVGGMALGIRVARWLDYFKPVHAHLVIGLLVCSVIIVFQPLLGALQHQHFKRTGGRSAYAHAHRWIGRGAIVLGMVNNGLGFQLASRDVDIEAHSYIRNFVLVGVLSLIWLALILYDDFVVKRRPQAVSKDQEKAESSE